MEAQFHKLSTERTSHLESKLLKEQEHDLKMARQNMLHYQKLYSKREMKEKQRKERCQVRYLKF
jgi:hypothetical protein